MPEHNSPTYRQGCEDGLADTSRVKQGDAPLGPRPPFPDYPVMYQRGYDLTFNPVPPDDDDEAADDDGAFDVDTEPITVSAS